MQLGFGSYTFTWSLGVPGYALPSCPMTPHDLIKLASGHNLPLIQLADNVPLHTYSASELRSIRDTAIEHGVQLEIGTRGTDRIHLKQYLDIAQYMNASLLRTIIVERPIRKAEEDIAAVLPDLERTGIRLAIENHGLHSTVELRGLFDRLGHPLIGCCLDTVNSFSALEMPRQVIADLAPYVVNLHIKDFDIKRLDHQMGFMITGMPAGSGRLDIPGMLEEIRSLGKSPTCILELWTPYSDSVDATAALEREWFDQSMAYLLDCFKRGAVVDCFKRPSAAHEEHDQA